LCNYALHLTQYPAAHEDLNGTKTLKEAGLSDKAVLDITLVTSYFNFVNRMLLSLAVQLEKHNGEGFRY
jgi:alkylhydroperoxidase family enzyme